jgi:ATP:ADP antiporter, AAA family
VFERIKAGGAHPIERPAAWASFGYFFLLLAAYYVLRPVRDEMAMQLGRGVLHELLTTVFLTMLVLVPVFGWLTSRFRRRELLPWLYGFFCLNLVAFFFLMLAQGTQAPWVARLFFVWVSVFNLFAVSVFWSFMADVFSTEQARRMYGFIAAGGTCGALAGPLLTAGLVGVVGAKGLMLVSAVLLVGAILLLVRVRRWASLHANVSAGASDQPMGGGMFSGLMDVVRTPYLLAICFFLLCYALLSTFLYFQQIELVPAAISDSVERTRLLAQVDLAVNFLTLLVQLAAFDKLIRRLGITGMLISMPILSVIGFAALALSPLLSTLLIFGILRRAGEYAISKPSRETLFNVLPPEQKYKAKNVIDTLVHRFGDVSSGWIYNGLKSMGLSITAMSWVAVPVGVAWVMISVWLGRAARARQELVEPPSSGSAP